MILHKNKTKTFFAFKLHQPIENVYVENKENKIYQTRILQNKKLVKEIFQIYQKLEINFV